MTPDQQQRLDQLIGYHLDGALSPDQTRELAGLLAADGEARKTFARSLAMDTALPQVVRRRRPVLMWSSLAAAALIAVGVAWWLLGEPDGPRLEPGSQAVVVRGGRELPAADAGVLRAADRVRTGETPAVLVWPEGTRATLAAAGTLDLVAAGPRKDLYLDGGRLQVDAAPQGQERSLQVRTDRLAATVVGTRFRVASGAGSSSLAVEHGSVMVDAGGQQRTVSTGQLAVLTGERPLWISPAGQDLSTMLSAPAVRLDPIAWQRDQGHGWFGTLYDGAIQAAVEATAERVANPQQMDGYTRMLPDIAITADVTLAKPGTLAIFLVCRRADGRDWLGNYTVQQDLPAGRHHRSWSAAELRVEKGAPLSETDNARIVSVAICTWPQGTGLQVHAVDIAHAGR
jgi:ferric-dicitrate binding protein FerR (iron transport regulator)